MHFGFQIGTVIVRIRKNCLQLPDSLKNPPTAPYPLVAPCRRQLKGAAIGILRDPIRNKKLDGYFYINFGNRDFENFNQKKEV